MCVFYFIWWRNHPQKYFFVGPDTGRTLLVRHRTKNKTTKMVVYISGGEITHKKYFFCGARYWPDSSRPTQDQK